MRISDWSSDVCSSDLDNSIERCYRLEEIGSCSAYFWPSESMSFIHSTSLISCSRFAWPTIVRSSSPCVQKISLPLRQRAEIGRETGRERVWQEALISVGDGQLKQKNLES